MDILEPVVQPYAWGSRHVIAELLGRATPSPTPEAELWMGAHPSHPSGLTRDGVSTTLDAVVSRDPAGELGAATTDRFGPRLPFLLKVLAIDKALSIQVHPSRQQAEAGFRAQQSMPSGPRNYVDDWPKPEVIVAVTRLEALAGFRTPIEAAEFLSHLSVEELQPLAADLRSDPDPATLLTVFERIVSWPETGRSSLIHKVVTESKRIIDGPFAPAAAVISRIAADHPDDIGVVCALLLRHIILEPGEALFMPAGGIHAYVRGVGIELLANSDNVLRAGLTGKHIDVAELLRVVDPGVRVPVVRARSVAAGVGVYDVPVPEFTLYRLDPHSSGTTVPGEGPRVVFCLEGSVSLNTAAGQALRLDRGESCFIPARDGQATATGPATLYVATVA